MLGWFITRRLKNENHNLTITYDYKGDNMYVRASSLSMTTSLVLKLTSEKMCTCQYVHSPSTMPPQKCPLRVIATVFPQPNDDAGDASGCLA